MPVHSPKPLQGWRQIAGEVGIIVLGVLIPLGAEQPMLVVHQDSEAREARQIVIGEIEQNLDPPGEALRMAKLLKRWWTH